VRSQPLSRFGRFAVLAIGLLCSAASLASDDSMQLAWLRSDRATLFELDAGGIRHETDLPEQLRTPLGSLWKLFVHAYLVDRALPETDYLCNGGERDEVYCCERGGRIGRERALVQSCGLYYAPQRLQIEATAWRDYWQTRRAPAWLIDLAALQPQTEVPVVELLHALETLPAQQEIRRVLLDVAIEARDERVPGELGAQWRVKTWSWHRDDDVDLRIGGFAGWRVDGTPVWAMARGTSQSALSTYRGALAQLPAVRTSTDNGECVDVALFARYPIASVQRDEKNVDPGVLNGDFRVVFKNSNALAIHSDGELILTRTAAGPSLVARLTREDYVARVLDREAAATPAAAARALSIAIRSYLQQNATRNGSCLQIADSSAQQRVAPRPASTAAREVAAWTSDLVLTGAPVMYHVERAEPGRLSWKLAVEQAEAGLRYDEILAGAFPRADLSRWDRPVAQCAPVAGAAEWLRGRLPNWRPRLNGEAGYGETGEFEICRLASGRPHVDRDKRRIFIRALSSQQDRLDLTHEYLHLAFAAHPNGQDETYIEALARRLLLE
jgi:uncharacterized protein YfaQ (DUF2300 family)